MTADRDSSTMRVGLISDTHGWLDPRAIDAFEREAPLSAIVHAGDIGSDPGVLYELEAIAPVTAVLGNCDYGVGGFDLAGLARLTVGHKTIVVVHDVYDWVQRPGDHIVVCGHTHRPRVEWVEGVLFLNPGSATQRRNQPSCSVGVLEIPQAGAPSARVVYLDDLGPRVR